MNRLMERTKINFKSVLVRCLLSLLFLWTFVQSNSGIVRAEELSAQTVRENLDANKSSVVRVESICGDRDGNVYKRKSFTGFVVTAGESGEYVVTVDQGLTYSEKEKDKIISDNQLEKNTNISDWIEVVFDGDLRVVANIVGESEQRNLALLGLSKSVKFEKTVVFPAEPAQIGATCYMLCYPGSMDENAVYNEEHVSEQDGTILDSFEENGSVFLKHSVAKDKKTQGGLMIDRAGYLVGMLLTYAGEEDGIAVSSETIRDFVGTYNVSVTVAEVRETGKKISKLNIALAVVIVILLIVLIIRLIGEKKQGGAGQNAADAGIGSGKKGRSKGSKSQGSETKKVGRRAMLTCPSIGKEFVLHHKQMTIGRSAGADIVVPNGLGMSRKHASIQYRNKQYYLSDLGSTNHTYLNGLEVKPGAWEQLCDGDEITAGKEKLRFVMK